VKKKKEEEDDRTKGFDAHLVVLSFVHSFLVLLLVLVLRAYSSRCGVLAVAEVCIFVSNVGNVFQASSIAADVTQCRHLVVSCLAALFLLVLCCLSVALC